MLGILESKIRLKRIQIEKRVRLAVLLVLVLVVAAPAYIAFGEFDSDSNEPQEPAWGWVNWGGWEYSVLVRPNDMNIDQILGSGQEYYDNLVEGIKARLTYTMATDTPARINGWYEIAADLASGDQLSEHRLVVPRTLFVEENGTNVSLELDIDIDRDEHLNRLHELALQAGLSVAEDSTVTYTATVEVNVTADGDSAHQTVNPTLIVPVGGLPTFTLSGEQSVYGNGTAGIKPRENTDDSVFALSEFTESGKLYSLLAVVLVALLPLAFSLGTTSRSTGDSSSATDIPASERLAEPDLPDRKSQQLDREVRRIRRKYRKRIAHGESGEWLPGREAVPVASMEDLIRVADEVLKPIIYSDPVRTGEPHVFYTIDGPTRYEFRVSLSRPNG